MSRVLGALDDRLIAPLAIAALNTLPAAADAGLMAAVMRQSLLRGGAACIPSFPRIGLSESFVDPAVAILRDVGSPIQFGRRVTAVEIEGGRVVAMQTTDGPVEVAPKDAVILAAPAPVAGALLPRLVVPDAFEAILNVHFRTAADPGPAGFYGVVGGLAEWVFIKPGIVSITISAANRFAELLPEQAAAQVWRDVSLVCGLSGPMPPMRVVREKRATFAATPAQNARRPSCGGSGIANLMLAGDWTQTGLPATIEGAIRSGRVAARACASAAPELSSA